MNAKSEEAKGLNALRQPEMHHKANVRLVQPHSKSHSCDHHFDLAMTGGRATRKFQSEPTRKDARQNENRTQICRDPPFKKATLPDMKFSCTVLRTSASMLPW